MADDGRPKRYARLKYPQKFMDRLLPKGTVVELLEKDDSRLLAIFPNMVERDGSCQVAIVFPGAERPTIAHRDQIEPC